MKDKDMKNLIFKMVSEHWEFGRKMQSADFLISYRGEYLPHKNYIHICFIGECEEPTNEFVNYLRKTKYDIKWRGRG